MQEIIGFRSEQNFCVANAGQHRGGSQPHAFSGADVGFCVADHPAAARLLSVAMEIIADQGCLLLLDTRARSLGQDLVEKAGQIQGVELFLE